jgi:hypothetical protein
VSDAPPLLTGPLEFPVTCPVCATASSLPICSTCGWTVVGDLVLGPAGTADREQLEAELATARRRISLDTATPEVTNGNTAPTAEDISIDEVIDQMGGGTAPLAHDYALVLAQPMPAADQYDIRTHTLFAAGSGPSATASQVRVSAPPGTATGGPVRLDVPVVALTGDRREDWTLVQVVELDLAAGESVLLTFHLTRPGQVEITADAAVLRPAVATWPELLDRLGRSQQGVPLNVVVALELGGPENDARVAAAIGVLERVEQTRPAGLIQVATILYWDHDLQPRSGRRPGDEPPRIRPFKPVNEVLSRLRDLVEHDAAMDYPYAAALEDALHSVASLHGWQTGDRALLVLATRAPHAADDLEDDTGVRPCPKGLNWRSALPSPDDWIGRTVLVVPSRATYNTMSGREADRRAEAVWAEFAQSGWDVVPGDAFQAEKTAASKLAPEPRSTCPVPFPVISSR